MISYFYKTIKDNQFEKLEVPRKGTLIVVDEAKRQDLKKIKQLTGLEYADLRDALDENEIPRVERTDGKVLLFIRLPSKIHKGIYTEPLTIIFTSEFLIAISTHKADLVMDLLAGRAEMATTQKTKLLLALLLKVARVFSKEIKQVADTVAGQKKEFQSVDGEDIMKLAQAEEVLNQYLAALVPMRNVFDTMLSRGLIKLYQQDNDLLQDLYIGISQSVDVCNVNLTSIRNLRDAYQTIFTNDLNRVMKLLTSFTIILTIPTIVASIYGMNVGLPLDKNPLAFGYIMGIIGVLSLLGMVIFRLKKWL